MSRLLDALDDWEDHHLGGDAMLTSAKNPHRRLDEPATCRKCGRPIVQTPLGGWGTTEHVIRGCYHIPASRPST